MSHDRARLSALVDGELDHDARDRVLAHLAQCDECRAVVDTERRVKALLNGMPEASPGGDFLARLNSLGDPNAEPVAEPPAPAKRRMVGRGRAAGSKRSGATQPMPPTATAPESSRPSLGALGLRVPMTGVLAADGQVVDDPHAGEPAADALGAGVQTSAGFPLGVLRIGEQRSDTPAVDDIHQHELTADQLRSGQVRFATPPAGEPGAGELSTGRLRFGEPRAGELGAGDPLAGALRFTETHDGELSGREPAGSQVQFSDPSGRRSRGSFGGPTRPAASRPFGYPDLHGSRRPGRLRSARLRSSRLGRRFTVGVAGAASLAGMALVTAFTVGGAGGPTTADVKVVPPIQRYTVQHADSVVNLPYSDPGAATATIGDSNLTGLLSPNR